jgi:predicted AAA+ superfamily ATPase
MRQNSESLAGRIGYHRLHGFALDEVGPDALDRLWLRGGFPRSFLAPGPRRGEELRVARIQIKWIKWVPVAWITVFCPPTKPYLENPPTPGGFSR